MSEPLPPGPHRATAASVSSLISPGGQAALGADAAVSGLISDHEGLPRPGGWNNASPFAFVSLVAIELAFVFGLLVFTKLDPAKVLQVAAATTAISVAGFFGRNAIVTIGQRMIAGSGNQ